MGAVVSSSEEKYESVFAKRCFEKYVVADVYELCALSKRVMAPVMRRRVAEGWNLKKGDDECVESGSDDGSGTESESGSASDSDDSDGGGGAASSGPLTSLFGVDLTYADYFDVFGVWLLRCWGWGWDMWGLVWEELGGLRPCCRPRLLRTL